MKKKWTLVLMAFVFVLSMCGFAACNEKGNDTPGGAEITIGVTPSSLKLDRYEEYKLTATVTGSEETPSWSSDNTAVATVTSDGTVAAAGVGEATITAKIGDASGTCKVTVEDTLKRPKLSIGQLDTEEGAYLLALLQGETFTLEPSVSYGSDEVEDVSYTFESQNSEIAEVSAAGVVTAKSVGSVQITVKTNWNVKIFIGSDDSETRKEFSELCGNKKIKQFSVNTNAENPASSNTGATTQPLITVGMLERLNGDEKGDAIVSVRGYEPIWTVFTPSYELKKTYFPEGKAAIGKREAVLFEKEKYVFDISGESGQSMEDKINEVIEEREAEKAEMLEKDKERRVAELTKKWDDVEAELQRVVDNVCNYLDGTDEKALRQASYENKARLLLMITENYQRSIADEIRVAADKIQLELLPKMKEYQEQAKR